MKGPVPSNPYLFAGPTPDATIVDMAEAYGGEGETQFVPSKHVIITYDDLVELVETGEPLLVNQNGVAIGVHRHDSLENMPHGRVDANITLTRNSIEKISQHGVLNFGIRHIDGEAALLTVSCGPIADKLQEEP